MIKQIMKIFAKDFVEIDDGVETWVVKWFANNGYYDHSFSEKYQCFTSKESATLFSESIKNAHKLIGNTHNIKVEINKQENGL